VGAVSHDRFRYGLIVAAYALGVFLFVRPLAVGLRMGGKQFPVWSWPWFWTSFTLPTAALAIVLIFKSLAKRDHFRANYGKFQRTFDLFLDLAVLLAIGTHLLILSKLMILEGLVGRWIFYVPTTLIGIILVILGNVLPRLRPNSTMGIRTRWTLRDEIVWMRTHRASGYLLVIFGLILIAWTFIDFQGIWWVLGPVVILTAAGLPFLSFIIWKRRRRLSTPAEERADKKEVSP
jgi:uncharacterized membrane protein